MEMGDLVGRGGTRVKKNSESYAYSGLGSAGMGPPWVQITWTS